MPASNNCLQTIQKFENALSSLKVSDSKVEQAEFAAGLVGDFGKKPSPFMDKVWSYQSNSLLSGTQTSLAGAVSLPAQMVVTPLVQAIETIVRKAKGQDAAFSDLFAGFSHMLQNFQVATRMGWEGMLRGHQLDLTASLGHLGREMGVSKKVAKEALDEMIIATRAEILARQKGTTRQQEMDNARRGYAVSDADREVFLRENTDYMRKQFTGPLSFIQWPTQVIVGIDEFGKSLFRMYRAQQEVHKASRQKAKASGADFKQLYNSNMERLWKGAVDSDAKDNLVNLRANLGSIVGKDSQDFMPYESVRQWSASKMFQQPLTGMPRAFQNLIQNEFPAARIFVPFMKTPWNIKKEGVSYLPFVPSVLRKALGPKVDAEGNVDIRKLGAFYELSKEEMLARQMVGGMVFLGLGAMWDSNELTGSPRNSQEREAWKTAGIPEKSIKIGGEWYGYGRVEPVATVLNMYAELRRVADEYYNVSNMYPDIANRDVKLLQDSMFAFKAAFMEGTFFDGLGQMFEQMMRGDVAQAVGTAARQAVPTMASNIARVQDPYERQASRGGVEAITDRVIQRIPGLRETLPIEYGLYGGAREAPSTASIMTGFTSSSDVERTPLQQEVARLDINKIRPSDTLRGVGLTNQQLSDYRKITAETLTEPLNKLVADPKFQKLPVGQRKVVMQRYIDKLKSAAVRKMYSQLMNTNANYAGAFLDKEYIKSGLYERVKGYQNQ